MFLFATAKGRLAAARKIEIFDPGPLSLSKEYLSGPVAGETVRVDWNKRDRYKRIVGKVIHEGRDINLETFRAGLDWWYRKYAYE